MPGCPNCSSSFLRPALPTLLERVRLRLTRKLPVECWHCGWRGWMTVPEVEQLIARAAGGGPVSDDAPGQRDTGSDRGSRPRAAS
jgi:hypothetical protein